MHPLFRRPRFLLLSTSEDRKKKLNKHSGAHEYLNILFSKHLLLVCFTNEKNLRSHVAVPAYYASKIILSANFCLYRLNSTDAKIRLFCLLRRTLRNVAYIIGARARAFVSNAYGRYDEFATKLYLTGETVERLTTEAPYTRQFELSSLRGIRYFGSSVTRECCPIQILRKFGDKGVSSWVTVILLRRVEEADEKLRLEHSSYELELHLHDGINLLLIV